jgi:hypothetical protein
VGELVREKLWRWFEEPSGKLPYITMTMGTACHESSVGLNTRRSPSVACTMPLAHRHVSGKFSLTNLKHV